VPQHWKRYQKGSDSSYAEGVFSALELLAVRPERVSHVLLSSRSEPNEGVGKLRTLCADHGIDVSVDDRSIERLSPRGSHLALAIFQKYETELGPSVDHVVLVEPADMGNLGTIARTMVGFGFRNLALIRPAVDAFDPKSIRASMGALFRLSFAYFDSFDAYAREFPRPAFAFMTDGRVPLDQVEFPLRCALVFGNESSGLPARFHEVARSVAIPQTADVDSLSLPTAAAVALYEVARQRRE
jgi:TrmH family RNA methyltransferase